MNHVQDRDEDQEEKDPWLLDAVTVLSRMANSDTIQKFDIYPCRAKPEYYPPSSNPIAATTTTMGDGYDRAQGQTQTQG